MNRTNKKGNAAVIALLVMIIIVGIAAIVMIMAGRNDIDEDKKFTQTSSVSTVQTAPSVTSATSPTTTAKPDLYPKNDAAYRQTSIKDMTAAASILVDLDTDTILAGHNMDAKIFPASITKVMTILVACENLRSYDDTYTFKEADFTKLIEQNASRAGFKAGEAVTAKDLLYAAILPSGADGVVGLENLVAGSEAAFVKLMNQRAQELGLKNTHFVNAIGLHDPNHYSTVKDLAVIMKVANHNVTCRNVMSTAEYKTARTSQNPEGINLNSLLFGRLSGFYIDKNGNGSNDDTAKITGGKTGFTDEAGNCMATLCDDSSTGHTYTCIVVKCSRMNVASAEIMSMYEKYLPGSKANIPDAVTTTSAQKADATATTTKKQAAATTKKKAA